MRILRSRCLWAPLTVVLACGCGQSGPKVVNVSGTVTSRGTPVGKLALTFVPDKGRPSSGETDQEGHYVLRYEPKRDGAEVGTHTVWVQLRPSSPKEEADMARGTVKLHPQMKHILQKYGRNSSLLKVEVKDEKNQVLNLQLD